ncbi:type II secretion system F family protein [Desulfotomaculum copahuensis]|uniref:Type II secretion system protein GspF domain-containing protein n=1 Tax=Desulfotomaculum copahuensis TaxID=1838280 RepID=A0A1B7LBK5_9FIRM|nr:type II secretion system F family protein [Desulfotomaculum copahuensis]OAT79870.1 hypothetical protein A6M21_14820 [Desulfotomaculum copahuensis]
MPATSFVYRARDGAGKIQIGYIEADGPAAAAALLRQRRYYVVNLRPAPEKGRRLTVHGLNELLEKKVGVRDLALFCRQFVTVVEAGIPLLTCLDILARQAENPRLARAIADVARELQGGRTLAEAMARQHHVFPGILISMIEAGELGGVLDQALLRMADHFERDYDIREKVKSAMYYPFALVCIGTLAVGFIVTTVLPRFATILQSSNIPLPLPTLILMGVANFLSHYWYLLPGGLALLFLGVQRLLRIEQVQHRLDALKLRLPIFGPLIKKVVISRFCRTLATLIHAGVPLIQALTVVQGTAGNHVVAEVTGQALENVREGLDMGGPLARSSVFPPLVSRMIMVGEETGTLDQLLEKVANFYDREVNAGVARLSSLLEPVLLLFMGAAIGSVILAIMLPMFKVMSGAGLVH